MRPVIIVFARAPLAGTVKTRLVPAVTAREAAILHTAFVCDTLHNLLDFNAADVELHTDIETDAWDEFPVPQRLQHEGDLGLKMFHALESALAEGRPSAMILGGDAPDLPAAHIPALFASAADITLGPCDDGGFYAIAARRVHPAMFDSVAWSTPEAMEQTVTACRACGLTVHCGPRWNDIDTGGDLTRLRNSKRAPASAAALRHVQICLE